MATATVAANGASKATRRAKTACPDTADADRVTLPRPASGMTPEQIKARLDNLAGQAGKVMFERVRLAAELMANLQWVCREFRGDDRAAREYLEARYFGEMMGTVHLGQLFTLYSRFPDPDEWKVRQWNVQKMWAEHLRQKEAEGGGRRGDPPKKGAPGKGVSDGGARSRPTVADVVRMAKEIETTRRGLVVAKEAATAAQGELRRLRTENEVLRREVDQLRGENRLLREQAGRA